MSVVITYSPTPYCMVRLIGDFLSSETIAIARIQRFWLPTTPARTLGALQHRVSRHRPYPTRPRSSSEEEIEERQRLRSLLAEFLIFRDDLQLEPLDLRVQRGGVRLTGTVRVRNFAAMPPHFID